MVVNLVLLSSQGKLLLLMTPPVAVGLMHHHQEPDRGEWLVHGMWKTPNDRQWMCVFGTVMILDVLVGGLNPVLRPTLNLQLQGADASLPIQSISVAKKLDEVVPQPAGRITDIAVLVGLEATPVGFTKLDRSLGHSGNLSEVGECLFVNMLTSNDVFLSLILLILSSARQGVFGGAPVFLAVKRGIETAAEPAIADIGLIVHNLDATPEGAIS